MKRRAALYLFGTTFALLVLTLFVVQHPRFEAYVCARIEAEAGAQLAAKVKIDHIQIRLLALQPRIELWDIEVFPVYPGKQGVASEPSFQARSARVVVRPLQLWARRLDVDRIEVDEPHLDLTQKNGKWIGLPPGLFIRASGPSGGAPTPNTLALRIDAFLVKNGILHLSAETNDLQLGLVGIDALGTFEANGSVVVDVTADGRRVNMKVGEDWFEEFIDSVKGELVINGKSIEIRGAALETDSLSVVVDGQIGLGSKTDVQLSQIRAIAPLEFVQRIAPTTPSMLGELDWLGTVIVNDKGFRMRGLAKVNDFWLERFHFGATQADIDVTQNGANVRRASFDGAGGAIEGPIAVAWPDDKVTITADLALEGVSFARVLDMTGVTGSHVDMGIDGKVSFTGGVSPLAITGRAELAHAGFTWRDKAWNEEGPVSPNLRVPAGALTGGFAVTDAGIQFHKVGATAGSAGLSLDGDVFFRGATDLTFAAAPLALSEISPIGAVTLAGTGPAKGRIHGDFENIVLDGELALVGVKVAGFDFGDGTTSSFRFATSKGTLESDFTRFVRGASTYGGRWKIDLSSPPSMDVEVKVEAGSRIEDLADIVFAELKAGEIAQGKVNEGRLSLKGPFERLDGSFVAKGADLAVKGEKFSSYRASGRWRQGAIWVDDLVATKGSGAQLYARGSLGLAPDGDKDGLGGTVNLEAHTSKMALSDLGALAKDAVVASDVGLRLHVGGRFYRPELKGRLDLGGTLLYGQAIGASQINFATTSATPDGPKDRVRIDGTVAGGTIKPLLTLHLVSTSSLPFGGEIALTKHNLKPYFMGFNPRLAKDPDVKASLAGVVKVSGDLMNPSQSVIGVFADSLAFQRGKHRLFNKDPLVASFGPGATYDLTQIHLVGDDEETDFTIKGFRKGEVTRVGGAGQLDLAFAELATNAFARVEGVLDVKDFHVNGDAYGTDYGGTASIVGGTFKTRFFPIGPEDLTADVELKDREIKIRNMRGKLGGGTFDAPDSAVTLGSEPGCAVKEWNLGPFNLTDVNMKFPSYAFAGRVTGPMTFSGAGCSKKTLPELRGNLVLEEAKYSGPIEWKASTVAFKASATEVFVASEDAPTFKLNVELTGNGDVWVRNDLGNIEFRIDPRDPLTVVGDNTAWGIMGSLRLVRGKIVFQSREFTLTNADITFDDEKQVDFNYDVSAETLVRDWQVTIHAKGRRSRGQPQFDKDSTPPLSPEDVNLLLIAGLTAQELKANGQDAALFGIVAGSTLGQGLGEQRGVTSRIKKALKLDAFDVVPSYAEGGAIGIKAVGRSTVNDDFSVNYSVGQSDRVTGSVQGDYRLSRRIHIVGGWSNEEQRASVKSEETLNEQGDVSIDARFRFEWK